MMNLYLVDRSTCSWDEVDSCMLFAENEEQAINMVLDICVENYTGKSRCYTNREELTVTLIETPKEPKILLIQTKDG